MIQLEFESPLGSTQKIRRHRLANGLRVVTLVDDRAPIASFQTWIPAGSCQEYGGRTGLAHFLEHLMFTQDFDRAVEVMGGDANAATWVDWTSYRTTVPAEVLPELVALEATRLMQLSIDEESLERERSVIERERVQRVEDDLDGLASERLFAETLRSSPYEHPTIGWMQDIRNTKRDELRAFYETHYRCSDIVLVVVGQFEEEKILASVAKHYSGLQPSADQDRSASRALVQQSAKAIDLQSESQLLRLLNGFAVPGQVGDSWCALHLACQLLAGGASSPMQRELVIESEMCSHIDCELMPFRDQSIVELSATLAPGTRLPAAQAQIDDILLRHTREVSADDLALSKTAMETDFWMSLASVEGKADLLGHFECVLGDCRKAFATLERTLAVSAEEIRAAVAEYLNPDRRVALRVSPRMQEAR